MNQKKLTKHILCDYKSKFDFRKCNLNHKWKNDKYRCDSKSLIKHMEKILTLES